MPRIPSVSDVRSIPAGVTRDPGLRAQPEDFGLGVARGIAGIGEGLGDLGDGIEARRRRKRAKEERVREREEQEAQNQAFRAMSERLEEVQRKTEAVERLLLARRHAVETRQVSNEIIDAERFEGGSPLSAAKESEQELIRQEEVKLKALPPESRPAARAAAAPIRQGHGLRAAQRLQNQKAVTLKEDTAKTLALLREQAITDPSASAKLAAEGLELLHRLHGEGGLSDADLSKQSTTFRRELYAGMLRGQAAGDVVADLEAGFYDEALSDPALKQLLLTEGRWRFQAVLAQGRANGRMLVEREARGEPRTAELSAATKSVLSAGEFADFELEVESARRVRSTVEGLRFAPESAFDSEIGKLAPAPDAQDQAARRAVQEAVRQEAERLLEQRRADPADYVMDLPSVARAFAAAKEDPTLLPVAIRGRLASQQAMGMRPEQQRALTKGEVDEILQGYQALPESARLEAAKGFRAAYGDEIGRVVAELEEAGLSPSQALMLQSDSDPVLASRVNKLMDPEASNGEQRTGVAGIIQETADRLIAEAGSRRLPPRPNLKPAVSTFSQGREAVAGERATPSLPQRKPSEANAGLGLQDAPVDQNQPTEAVVTATGEEPTSVTDGMATSEERQSVEVVSTLAAEKELEGLLVTMGVRPDLRGENAVTVLPLVHEVMNVRTIVAAGDFKRFNDIKQRIEDLQKTEHRFLFAPLREKLRRALNRPETAPWALTNAELVSAYKAVGGSSELLEALGGSFGSLGGLLGDEDRAARISADNKRLLAFGGRALGLAGLAAFLAGAQQGQLRKSYEAELERRSFGKLDPDRHPSGRRLFDLQ